MCKKNEFSRALEKSSFEVSNWILVIAKYHFEQTTELNLIGPRFDVISGHKSRFTSGESEFCRLSQNNIKSQNPIEVSKKVFSRAREDSFCASRILSVDFESMLRI